MSKIKLKEIADAIREKDGTTEPIVANDFALRIRTISGSEDLTTELNTQDGLLTNLETEINGLPSAGGGANSAIIRTAELANVDITLSKDGTTVETKNTGNGGKVDFNVSEVGTYTVSTSTWSKDVVVEELNTIVKAYAGNLVNYNEHQIHEACQGGYASLMWKPKDQWTYPNDSSIYANQKVMITKIKKVGDKEQIKWCLASRLSTNYNINPRFGYLTSSTDAGWSRSESNNGGMKYSAIEQRFKIQGEEVYSQATGILPEDYSGTLTTGVKPSGLYYTDQNGTLCKVYDYDKETDSFTETNVVIYTSLSTAESGCKFIKGYFKSVGVIDETTFNTGYYYTYDGSNYVYTRATAYTSGTIYYGLYETLQEDGVFIAGLSSIRQYLVKEERKASAGGKQETYLSSFTDYANLLAVEEITGLYRGLTLPSGVAVTSIGVYNLHGEGEKEEAFVFEIQTIGKTYWTRSTASNSVTNFYHIHYSGNLGTPSVYNTYGTRAVFTTN